MTGQRQSSGKDEDASNDFRKQPTVTIPTVSANTPAQQPTVAGTLPVTPSPAATPAAQQERTITWARMKASTEIRLEPDGTKPVLLIAAAGDAFSVQEQSGTWVKVKLDKDQQGWLPVEQASLVQAPATDTLLVKASAGTRLFWGPDESLGEAKMLAANIPVEPVEISGQWIRLAEQADGKPLWIKAEQVTWTNGEPLVQEAWSAAIKPSPGTSPAPSLPLKGKTVVVDPGHGGKDPGAIAAGKPVYERDVNLAAASVLANKLRAAGARVIMTRTNNETFVSLEQRAKVSNDNKADAFISIHQNMYEKDPSVTGTITYYESAKSKQLALEIESAATRELNSTQAAVQVEKEQLYVLKHNQQPAVLVEGCFLSNPSELSASLLPVYQEKLAAGIYKGIVNYFHVS